MAVWRVGAADAFSLFRSNKSMTKSEELEGLRREFEQADPKRRLAAAERVLNAPELAREFVHQLLAGLCSQDEALREVCVGALEGMGPPEKADALKVIVPYLPKDELQGYWAATLIGRLATGGAAAVSELATTLNSSPSMAVRERCAWALGQIGPTAIAALPMLESAATSSEPRLARFAKEAISSISVGK